MSAEILQLLTRIAELERKLDSLFRHGPVRERKKIDGRWFVRLKIGFADDDPFLSPWIPYSSPNGGPLAMLGRPEGATIGAIMGATHWQQHSVRGPCDLTRRNSCSNKF